MPTSRGDYRYRVDLRGWLHDGAGSAAPAPARVVDLSRAGACLRFEGAPPDGLGVGRPVCLALDDLVGGRPVAARWLGRVAHAGALGDGACRVGLAFEGGRGVALAATLAALADAGTDAPRDGHDATALVATLAGLGLDQASKAWAWSLSPSLDGVAELAPGLLALDPVANHGALASLAAGRPGVATLCALTSLALATAAPWWAAEGRPRAVAAGLVAAGLLGNAGDRLALGFVRDFLTSPHLPGWAFNLADVFLLLGALTLLAPRRRP